MRTKVEMGAKTQGPNICVRGECVVHEPSKLRILACMLLLRVTF